MTPSEGIYRVFKRFKAGRHPTIAQKREPLFKNYPCHLAHLGIEFGPLIHLVALDRLDVQNYRYRTFYAFSKAERERTI